MGGAWWAAIYGVAQSWTRLKRFSSSSSSSSSRWITTGVAVTDLPGIEVSHTSGGTCLRILSGILGRTGSMVVVKAIFTHVNDKVALSLVNRSQPSRGGGQVGRTKKECVNRVFSREQGRKGVK